MATAHTEFLSVLVGPTCPTCEADDLRWGAPLGAPCQDGRCRDCGTEYRSVHARRRMTASGPGRRARDAACITIRVRPVRRTARTAARRTACSAA